MEIGFTFGMNISKNTCSREFEKMFFLLKHRSLLKQQATPPPFLFLSLLSMLYPLIFISRSLTVMSSFDSVIPKMTKCYHLKKSI